MVERKKILAINGSIRNSSSNKSVLLALAKLIPSSVDYEIYKGVEYLPHFNPDLDVDHSAADSSVKDFREKLGNCDAIIICTPEYAFGVPGVLKNALDWIVSSAEFTNKPTALITASPLASGGDKAFAALMPTLQVMGAMIAEDCALMIPLVKKKVNENAEISDQDLGEKLKRLLNTLLK